MFSGGVVIALMALLALFFATDFFYVRGIEVSGNTILSDDEIFRLTGIAEMHLFWLDPARIKAALMEVSSIADAQVRIGWPPSMVRIMIEERQPAAVWVQSGVAFWVDLRGCVLTSTPSDTGERPELIRVISDDPMAEVPGGSACVDAGAVAGAIQLQRLLPGLASLRYNPTLGLGFQDAGGWSVWLGVGTDMSAKLTVYDALAANLAERQIAPVEVNVSNPDGVTYCLSVELCGQ